MSDRGGIVLTSGVRKIYRFAAAVLAFALAVPEAAFAVEIQNTAETNSDTEIVFSREDSYGDYFDEYIGKNAAKSEVTVRGTDYIKASGGEFMKGSCGNENDIVKDDVLIWNSAEGTVTYRINVPETAVYNIGISYCPVGSSSASTELSLKIDGKTPFDSASRIVLNRVWVNESGITENSSGNQSRPSKIQ